MAYQHCERSELRLHFVRTKVPKKYQKWSILGSFWKAEACGQTVLAVRTKIGGKCKNWKTQMWHFDWFSNTVSLKMSHFTKLSELKNRHFWRFTNTVNDLFLRNKGAEKTPRWWIWHLESWYFVTKRLKQKWCQHSGARGRKIVIFNIKSRQH